MIGEQTDLLDRAPLCFEAGQNISDPPLLNNGALTKNCFRTRPLSRPPISLSAPITNSRDPLSSLARALVGDT